MHTPSSASRRCGLTLIELMVASALCGIAVTLIFFSWNYLTRHTVVQQRKSMFQAEADRMAQQIVMEIRRSPQVVSIKNNGISFLSSNGADTVSYEYSGTDLFKNKNPVTCVSPGARITLFTVERDNPASDDFSSGSLTLVVTLNMEDTFGNASLIPLKVMVRIPPNRLDSLSRLWNF